jgi:ribonuclease BN (tRNA processing enzyme)
MKVRVVGSACGATSRLQYASSYIVDGCLAVDAGCLGVDGTPEQQAAIRHVFLTHSHMDHVATLPMFLENAFDSGQQPVAVYGVPAVLDSLQRHIFNDVIWPDFVRLSQAGHPLLRLVPLKVETAVRIGDLSITPVAVEHVVPTYGYIVTDGASTVVFGGDSGPTERIWCLAARAPQPVSIFLEACFPNEMHHLASVSGHITPALFSEEVRKVPEAGTVIAIHIKARYHDQVVAELETLGIPGLRIGEPGREYEL